MLFLALFFLLCSVIAFSQNKKAVREKRAFFRDFFYSGSTKQKDFNEILPFTNNYGWAVLKVNIKGKAYHFIFDTGAPTSISEDLVKELNLKPLTSINLEDALGKSISKNVYRMNSISLGNITFLNEGCVGFDFSELSMASCIKIDGIIGSNLMKKCYWQINYQDNSIGLSSSLPEIPTNAQKLSFKEAEEGAIPVLELTIADTTVFALLDYGSNGVSTIPKAVFFRNKSKEDNVASGKGAALTAMNQKLESKMYRVFSNTFKLGNVTFNHQLFDILPNDAPPPLLVLHF